MASNEMKLFSKWHDCEAYENESGLRIMIDVCDSRVSRTKHYFVEVWNTNTNERQTIATRCIYQKAIQIAREYYFK